MTIEMSERVIQTLHIQKEMHIAAPASIVFDMILNPPGKFGEMSLKIEPFVGGRWLRDLGNGAGHWWGTVQVIKPPTLLELHGPMFMSYPAISHVRYRLAESNGGTLLTMTHQAMGMIEEEHAKGVQGGWSEILGAIKQAAEARKK